MNCFLKIINFVYYYFFQMFVLRLSIVILFSCVDFMDKMKSYNMLYFDSQKQNEFCKIFTHSDRVLPNGNIRFLGTKILFCLKKHIFTIYVMSKQQKYTKNFFATCLLRAGRKGLKK